MHKCLDVCLLVAFACLLVRWLSDMTVVQLIEITPNPGQGAWPFSHFWSRVAPILPICRVRVSPCSLHIRVFSGCCRYSRADTCLGTIFSVALDCFNFSVTHSCTRNRIHKLEFAAVCEVFIVISNKVDVMARRNKLRPLRLQCYS